MKKFIAPLLIGAALSSSAFAADDSLKQEVEALKAQMAELKDAQSKINVDALRAQVSEIKAHDAGDNIKWNVDFRTAYDYVDYKIQGADKQDNGVWTNKLILGMGAQPADNLVFKGSLAAYKAFGQTNISSTSYFQTFDWYDSQKPNDSNIRLREAYFLYTGDMGDVHYSASFGRRPSVDGFLANLRNDNENPASPISHNINMEFDGASFKFDFDKVTGISGLYAKLCLGRGFSNTTGAYSMNMSSMGFNPGYVNDDQTPNMDLAGLIVQFFDNGQYKLMGNYLVAKNMMDMNVQGIAMTPVYTSSGLTYVQKPYFNFADVGDMTGGTLSLQVNGIGDGISDFLDDSIFFLSYAFSKTDPNNNQLGAISSSGLVSMAGMLGSSDKEFGSSIYTGVQVPGIMKGQRLGLEYNHGSKYWRSFTYGEDTLAGSKLAARGNAYELYYIMPVVGKNLTAQLSYVYIDYAYTGSDTFFGWTGTPMDVDSTPGAVKTAQDLRLSLRYRY
ncbi:DUF3373 family protein [Sulfurospirillum diekertiae]|uniref:DUF3373 family protein n=1 Tax=Sulfurospirillum diekertiae TaxID=1854492 RepID=A0A6G9VSR4_9BACT|nr:DUF3373 family protein [Sulfurospirillum diekertiae]QIR75999.1 DUF3373 family protein [Sulfurospirillum diekertiae]QIR78642.1 DUF3373 family protein [Sulfurospirillum diekertiae]